MNKRQEHFGVIFMPDQQSSIVPQPGDAALDDPASAIAAQRPSVLSRRSLSAFAMGADQLDPSFGQSGAQLVAVGGLVVNQTLDRFAAVVVGRHIVQCRFNQFDFRRGRRGEQNSQRKTLAVDHHHKLRTLSAFGLSDAFAPFFAGTNVPSPNVSSQSRRPRSSSCAANARHRAGHTSCSSQKRKRRQQVLGLGYRSGKSCQRAPERRTHKIPSRQSRSGLHGRPPFRLDGSAGKSGAIFSHISSVKNGSKRAIGWLPPAHIYSTRKNQKLAKNVPNYELSPISSKKWGIRL